MPSGATTDPELTQVTAPIVHLHDIRESDREWAGNKATTLGLLLARGFPVPPGVVVPPEVEVDEGLIVAIRGAFPAGSRLAVRSSGTAEDTADASYAGIYETVLDVDTAVELDAALGRVRASAEGARVRAYGHAGPLAVLVQGMVPAVCAGVAFTANPVTGTRGEVCISAVPGLGAALVDGTSVADEWVVTSVAEPRHTPHGVLNAHIAGLVADLARRVEGVAGLPQDVEWAWDGAVLWLLQARPMTALPDPVRWEVEKGGWLRSFRIGEQLAGPVTPLFESWAIDRLERSLMQTCREVCGISFAAPWHVLVNGWYFSSPMGSSPTSDMLGVLRRPRFLAALLLVNQRPDLAASVCLDGLARQWNDEVRPSLIRATEAAEASVEGVDLVALRRVGDELLDRTGRYLAFLAFVGGSAWKMEGALARFYRRHLDGVLEHGHQALLCGLAGQVDTPAHAVADLDWSVPGTPPLDAVPVLGLLQRRVAAEQACRGHLQGGSLRRFERLLAVCQRYARLREEQARDLTIAWPVLRRILARLGNHLAATGVVDDPADVHFLSLEELDRAIQSPRALSAVAASRRATHARQRRLTPPLLLGTLPDAFGKVMTEAIVAMRTRQGEGTGDVVGQPASPGVVQGRVRVIRTFAEAHRLREGEVLVCPVTTPAWTPLLRNATALVTDGGTLAAHASLIARELGVPAVVATGDGTSRLRTGQIVRVDGGLGTVAILAEAPAQLDLAG